MKVLGVVLARAGSVGLKDKHLVPLLGRPVISYTLDHAAEAAGLARVIVTSDCPLVRRFGTVAGFDAVSRPAELATSDASVQEVMLHALEAAEAGGAFRANALVVLYGNVPVRPAGVIDRAIEMLTRTGCDSVRSFCPVGKWHPAWMARLDGDRVDPLHPGSVHRRQDLEAGGRLLLHDGAVVAVSRESMLRGRDFPSDPHAFFGVDRRGFEVEPGETVEIDGRRDLFLAEAVLRERQAAGESHFAGPALRRKAS